MGDPVTIRCVACRSEFSEAEVMVAASCPDCGDKGLPMSIEDDVSVSINWHELKILVMWAERWAYQIESECENSVETVATIARILKDQFPDKSPLTLAGEIRQVRQKHDVELGGALVDGPEYQPADPDEQNGAGE